MNTFHSNIIAVMTFTKLKINKSFKVLLPLFPQSHPCGCNSNCCDHDLKDYSRNQ